MNPYQPDIDRYYRLGYFSLFVSVACVVSGAYLRYRFGVWGMGDMTPFFVVCLIPLACAVLCFWAANKIPRVHLNLIGMTEEEALQTAAKYGMCVMIVARDKTWKVVPTDYRADRYKLTVLYGRVAYWTRG